MSGERLERLPDLQAAVRALAGVAWASVVWPDPEGPATLHVTFEGGADAERVARSVLAAMAEIADVGPEGLRIREVVEPRTAAAGERPVLTDVTTSGQAGVEAVSVTLAQGGRTSSATAAVAPDAGTEAGPGLAPAVASQAAAAAVLEALRALLGWAVPADLDWVRVVAPPSPDHPEVINVTVSLHTAAGRELHSGVAIVRAGHAEAAARATLDALTRRLQRPEPRPDAGAA